MVAKVSVQILLCLLAALHVDRALSFTSTFQQQRRAVVLNNGIFRSMPTESFKVLQQRQYQNQENQQRRRHEQSLELFISTTANNGNEKFPNNTAQENILKEFEKKEAIIRKRREEALAKFNKYETTLTELQSKRAEYLAASQLAEAPVGGSFSETAVRSAVKAFVWRMVAGSVTFITTLKFSGSLSTAIQVVGGDFFSKALTMFLGERLMNKTQAGRKKGSDAVGRSFAKALIWRLFAICNTLALAVFVSKDLSVASKIASTDAVIKTTLMFLYERVWARIDWGKEYLIEFTI